MSRRTTALVECDRCGTRLHREDPPRDWIQIRVVHSGGGFSQDLCQNCYQAFRRFLLEEAA